MSGGINPFFLNLDIIWRGIVGLTP